MGDNKEGVYTETVACSVIDASQPSPNIQPTAVQLSRVSQKNIGIWQNDNMFRRNTFSKINIALMFAVALFAILATIFGVMYFTFEEKSCKPSVSCNSPVEQKSNGSSTSGLLLNLKLKLNTISDKFEVSQIYTAATLKKMEEMLKKTEKELEVLTNILALQVGSYQMPGNSCADIVNRTKTKLLLSSQKYWIVLDNDKPMKVFCDMKSDGGGWTLITNIVLQDSNGFTWSLANDYRNITDYASNTLGLSVPALEALRHKMPFTQLMFYCHKKIPGRTFHIVTKQNTLGNNVLRYFTGRTNSFPEACGSFNRLFDDNSTMAGECSKWGRESGKYLVGKWHHENYPVADRLINAPAFILNTAHWLIPNQPGGRWECDDFVATNGFARTAGDFWQIFVR